MAKIVDPKNLWFQEVASRDYYNENDLERTVMLYMENFFPEFYVSLFKKPLVHQISGKKNTADLCLIKRDYSEWYVIEVELGKHTKDEVIHQIDTFRNFVPDISHANYIYEERPGIFNLAKLKALILSKMPQLMVIVNEYKPDWKADLDKLSCKMCIFQIYNDFAGRRMYRIDGDHPYISSEFCYCKCEKYLPNTVRLLNSDFLDGYGINHGEYLTITYNGVSHKWQRQDSGKKVYVICESIIPPIDPLTARYKLSYKAPIIKINKFPKLVKWFMWATGNGQLRGSNMFSFIKD
jgi:hypothetical protein